MQGSDDWSVEWKGMGGWTPSRSIFFHALFMCVIFLLVHVAWEKQDGMGFSDGHSPNFLEFVMQTRNWLDEVGSAVPLRSLPEVSPRELLPPTERYPPITFLLSALGVSVFGPDPQVARLSSLPFVMGLVLVMGRLGWQVAGSRGAILLALGAATATWTGHYARVFSMALGQMFVLAAVFSLVLDSERLTRGRVCVLLGLVFGLGMLIKYSVLILALPVLLIAALPSAFRSRSSKLAILIILAETSLIIQMTWALILNARAQGQGHSLPLGEWTLLLMAEAVFLISLLGAWYTVRKKGCTPGLGLLVVASTCGLVCGPWYFAQGHLWAWFIDFQLQFTPATSGRIDSLSLLNEHLVLVWWLINTFYWQVHLLLILGPLALAVWGLRNSKAGFLLWTSLALVLIQALLLPPDPRYLASMAPALLILLFLWAARWRATFLACVLFMVLAGAMQLAGWFPPIERAATMLGLEMVPLPAIAGQSRPRIPVIMASEDLARWVPVAELPAEEPDPLKAIPAGSVVGIVHMPRLDDRPVPQFFEVWLADKAEVVILSGDAPPATSSLDYLIVISWWELTESEANPWNWPTEPRLFRVEVSPHTVYLYIHKSPKDRDSSRRRPPGRTFWTSASGRFGAPVTRHSRGE